MRMWMIDPKVMCRKHLMGSHVEIHMFLGTIKKKTSVNGYIANNLLEPKSLKLYHDLLVKEMERRNYNHSTEVSQEYFDECVSMLPKEFQNVCINVTEANKELLSRCSACRSNYQAIINE